jgi:shikimate kinase
MTNSGPIFLVGFMGAGKTTVGRSLAKQLDYTFYDLDELIEERAGKSIERIFSDLGEAEFRRLETEAIQACRECEKAVIALGGGAYVSDRNRELLREIGKTVWLACPLEICLARIQGDRSRPLLTTNREMKALLESRLPSYTVADFVVESGASPPEEIAFEITRLLSVQDDDVS